MDQIGYELAVGFHLFDAFHFQCFVHTEGSLHKTILKVDQPFAHLIVVPGDPVVDDGRMQAPAKLESVVSEAIDVLAVNVGVVANVEH